ncbi:putative disease resistance protein RGA1 [Lotus japonicus]|uniref:putative disease resistance protein RGA1 n=1 Tax=Lotus japonicus TaxID=34305 RepID=UPI00258A24F8|nr:putative disease resistance protein RGA1 [Lotus japonicus]
MLELSNYTDELLRSLSGFNGLTSLWLYAGDVDLTSFPVGTLSSLRTLRIYSSEVLKELPNELFKNLNNLDHLQIVYCRKLESLPEQGWEGLRSLRTLQIWDCGELKSLPDGVRHLTSLQLLSIAFCPALAERCKEGTGEDWDKIAHVPNLI